jgi:hypothetical protein
MARPTDMRRKATLSPRLLVSMPAEPRMKRAFFQLQEGFSLRLAAVKVTIQSTIDEAPYLIRFTVRISTP